MSQLLDCFSEAQIVAVLSKVRAALPPGGRLWILELFWDRQRFEAAAFSLQQTSLYFSCVANGNSQMYDSKVFLALLPRAGLQVTRLSDGVGRFHTLVECAAAEPRGACRRDRVIASAIETPALPPRGRSCRPGRASGSSFPPTTRSGRSAAWREAALALCPRVVVVDDGSTDATAAQLDGLALTVLRHPRNQGKAASLQNRVPACARCATRPASSPSTATASTTRATRATFLPSGAAGPGTS